MGYFKRGGDRGDRRSSGGFNRGSGGSRPYAGGGRFGGGKRFGGRDGDRPEMHKATCGECGAACEVPFRPSGDRPVYCRDCFAKQGGREDRPRSFGGDRHERPRFGDKQMNDAVCSKCGNDCQVPFRPTGERPVYCSNCFDKGSVSKTGGTTDSGDVAKQLKALNGKIDTLIALLRPTATTVSASDMPTEQEAEATDVVVEKKSRKSVSKKTAKKKGKSEELDV